MNDGADSEPAAGAQAVVFITHIWNDEVGDRLFRLIADCMGETGGEAGGAAGPAREVFVIAEPATPVPEIYAAITERFDFRALRGRARAVIGDKIVPGNCHLRALAFFDRHPGYAHYWFIEYDAVYAGDWSRLFAALDADPADLLATRFARVDEDPRWPWRRDLSTGDDPVGTAGRVRAFFPVHRMSAAAMAAVADAVARGWSGHFEMLVPTALAAAGLAQADIGGRSAWTPAGRRDRHYLDCRVPDQAHCFGTMRYRPAIGAMPVAGLLYHPVKTAGETLEPWSNRRRLATVARHPLAVAAHGFRFARAWARGWLGGRG